MLYVISYKDYLVSTTVSEAADDATAGTMLDRLPSGYSGFTVDPAKAGSVPLKMATDIVNLTRSAETQLKFKSKAEAFPELLAWLKDAPKAAPPQVDAAAVEPKPGKKPLTAAQLKRIDELAEKRVKRDAAKAEREANKTRPDEEKAAAKAAKAVAAKAKADAKKAADKPARERKVITPGEPHPVRVGTSLANLLTEGVKGTKTAEQIGAAVGLPAKKVMHRIFYVMVTRNGIAATVDKETKVITVTLPKGHTLDTMITAKAPAEVKDAA